MSRVTCRHARTTNASETAYPNSLLPNFRSSQTRPTRRLSTKRRNAKCKFSRSETRRCVSSQLSSGRGKYFRTIHNITCVADLDRSILLSTRQRELRHQTDGTTGGLSSDENEQGAPDDYRAQADDDEEERRIQARLHKLVAMSREKDNDSYGPGESSYQRQGSDHRSRDNDDYEAREKRYRRRDGSRERHSSASSSQPRHRSSRDDDRSPSRSRSSRWDVQRRKSPPSSSSGIGSRKGRLVDY